METLHLPQCFHQPVVIPAMMQTLWMMRMTLMLWVIHCTVWTCSSISRPSSAHLHSTQPFLSSSHILIHMRERCCRALVLCAEQSLLSTWSAQICSFDFCFSACLANNVEKINARMLNFERLDNSGNLDDIEDKKQNLISFWKKEDWNQLFLIWYAFMLIHKDY